MIGKLITAMAGRSIAKSIGGAAAGPTGAALGLAIPAVVPIVARRLGPVGMVAAALSGIAFTRWLERRQARREAAGGAPSAARPEAALGTAAAPVPPGGPTPASPASPPTSR